MYSFSISQLSNIINGQILKETNKKINNISIDYNVSKQQDAFFCINSSKYDVRDGGLGFTNNEDSVFGLGGVQNGHDYIDKVYQDRVKIIVIDDLKYYNESFNVGWILVDDTFDALKMVAKYCIDHSNTKTIAVTGSVGKTTTCQVLFDTLSKCINTEIISSVRNSVLGICMKLLNTDLEKLDCIIIEMQLDGCNQIKRFCEIANPDISIITNISFSHYSRFSSVDEIMHEKMYVSEYLKKNGVLIINEDDEKLCNLKIDRNSNRIIKIGQYNGDYVSKNIAKYNQLGFLKFDLFIHNTMFSSVKLNSTGIGVVYATLFSIAVADALGISIDSFVKNDLNAVKNPIGRFNCFLGVNDSQIIVDSYNANIKSMLQGIEYVHNVNKKKKILVLGSMLELGDKTEILHRQVGKYINDCKDNFIIITFGEAATFISYEIKCIERKNIYNVYSYDEIVSVLENIEIDSETIVYIKGSGGMRLELIAPYLLSKRMF